MNIYHSLGNSVPHSANLPAIYLGKDPHLSYAQLDDRARRIGGALRADPALSPGDRIAIVMTNTPEYFEVLFAVLAAGMCVVPINAKLHEREYAFILENSDARRCFVGPAHEDALTHVCAELRDTCTIISTAGRDYADMLLAEPIEPAEATPEDPAWLFYTSGTTGLPKGATLTHRNLWLMTLSFIVDAGPFRSESRGVMLSPLSHASGLLSMAYFAKSSGVVIPESGGFDPSELIGLINHHGNASFFTAPTMLNRLVQAPEIESLDVTRLETIVYGGGPMYVQDTKEALRILGPRLWQIYGQGETPCTTTFLSKEMHAASDHPRYDERLASVGVVRTGVTVRIVDQEGRTVPPGTVGEIVVCGDTVMSGYWKNEEATADTIRDGWLHTGDLGSIDEEGFLTLKDRSKDLIISGGMNIYPREIEEVLLMHSGVREAAVVGRPNAEWGEEPVAFIVLVPGSHVDESELDALCLENIARFKRPKAYFFIDDLPKNNYGKIVKTELRKRLEL